MDVCKIEGFGDQLVGFVHLFSTQLNVLKASSSKRLRQRLFDSIKNAWWDSFFVGERGTQLNTEIDETPMHDRKHLQSH